MPRPAARQKSSPCCHASIPRTSSTISATAESCPTSCASWRNPKSGKAGGHGALSLRVAEVRAARRLFRRKALLLLAPTPTRRLGGPGLSTHFWRGGEHPKSAAQSLQSDAPIHRLASALGRRHRKLGCRMGQTYSGGRLVAMLTSRPSSGEKLVLALADQREVIEREGAPSRFRS